MRVRGPNNVRRAVQTDPTCDIMGVVSQQCYVRLHVDCKTVGFFSKSVKKSVKRGVRVLRARGVFLASLPSLALCFQPHSRPFV